MRSLMIQYASTLLCFNILNTWVLAQNAYGPPLLSSVSTPTTCGPDVLTTSYIATIITTVITTITGVAELPHSCYSYSVTSLQSDNSYCGYFNSSTCPSIPECIIQKNSYLEVPCSDPCCPETPTITVTGTCVSCQLGCSTNILETITVTTGCSKGSKSRSRSFSGTGTVSSTGTKEPGRYSNSAGVSGSGSVYSRSGGDGSTKTNIEGGSTGRSSGGTSTSILKTSSLRTEIVD